MMPRSPLIVPGAASRGFVEPINVRTTFHVSSGPSTTMGTDALMLRVVTGRGRLVDGAQLQGNELEPLALDPQEDLTDQSPFDCVRLGDHQSPIHGVRRYR